MRWQAHRSSAKAAGNERRVAVKRTIPRAAATSLLSRPFRNECQKPARIVEHDLVQDLIASTGRFQLWQKHGQGLGVAAGSICGEHQMRSETGFDESHDHGNLLCVAVLALPIEADKRAAPANSLVNVDIRIDQISQVSDNDAVGFDTRVFEDIEL